MLNLQHHHNNHTTTFHTKVDSTHWGPPSCEGLLWWCCVWIKSHVLNDQTQWVGGPCGSGIWKWKWLHVESGPTSIFFPLCFAQTGGPIWSAPTPKFVLIKTGDSGFNRVSTTATIALLSLKCLSCHVIIIII
jgi:hypothetical protein